MSFRALVWPGVRVVLALAVMSGCAGVTGSTPDSGSAYFFGVGDAGVTGDPMMDAGVESTGDAGLGEDAGSPAEDAGGQSDAGGAPDAGFAEDAGNVSDAGAEDAGNASDAGSTQDAGTAADAGPTRDAGLSDAGSGDAGLTDGGPRDGGSSDAGAVDGGLGDGGSGDGGPGGGGCLSSCGAQAFCQQGQCAPARRVFVTSSLFSGNLGDVAGANASCNTAATQAALGGTWAAFVADTTTAPSVTFTQPAVPYILLDGTVIADDGAGVFSGTLNNPIDVDENGQVVANSEVWTDVDDPGVASGDGDCADFTSADVSSEPAWVGLTSATDYTWYSVYTQFCNRTNVRIYCFEQ